MKGRGREDLEEDACSYWMFLGKIEGTRTPTPVVALSKGWVCAVAYPGILFVGGGQQIQFRTEDRENGDLGAVVP
jgi:hypothetical protein